MYSDWTKKPKSKQQQRQELSQGFCFACLEVLSHLYFELNHIPAATGTGISYFCFIRQNQHACVIALLFRLNFPDRCASFLRGEKVTATHWRCGAFWRNVSTGEDDRLPPDRRLSAAPGKKDGEISTWSVPDWVAPNCLREFHFYSILNALLFFLLLLYLGTDRWCLLTNDNKIIVIFYSFSSLRIGRASIHV